MPTHTGTNATWDHDEIRRWAEERGAEPACVKGTGGRKGGGDVGMIRLDFPGFSGARSLQHISWDDWFQSFDDNNLALVYRDTTAGGQSSNFNKLVSRDSVEQDASVRRGGRRGRSGSSTSQRTTGTRRGASSTRKGRSRAKSGRATTSRGTASRGGRHVTERQLATQLERLAMQLDRLATERERGTNNRRTRRRS